MGEHRRCEVDVRPRLYDAVLVSSLFDVFELLP